ncbi:MAG: TIGR01244 family phosphatase [Sphingomonadales bacterium]|nr:TIGR01244 family phosphatase [Sphingomonadales bacterium]
MTITPVNDRLSVSPQIAPGDVAELHRAGYRCIVNARPDHEEPGQPDSAALAAEAAKWGLDYRHVPIVPGKMTDDQARAFGDIVAAAHGPVLAFCRTGSRAAKAWERSQELGAACG